MLKFTSLLIFWFAAVTNTSNAYEIPNAKFKIFYPKGFEVSIPADEKVTLFTFHGKLNEPLNGLAAATWSKDVSKPIDGRFTFRDNQTSLKMGDIIFYWTFVINKGLEYRKVNGVYYVREYTDVNKEQKVVYEVPKAEFKIFYPKGFEVSIPAEENMTLFAFHGKLNERMNGLESGKLSVDISIPINGRFVYTDRETSLKIGDIIYYWTFIINNRLGFREDDGTYVIAGYNLQNESTIRQTNIAPMEYKVPSAEFKIFYPQGFEVSIPADEGVTLFAFHGKLNEKMNGLESGKWSRDVTTIRNGRFIFEDRDTSLKIGDYIYYWTFVIRNGLGYREDCGIYLVSNYTTTETTMAGIQKSLDFKENNGLILVSTPAPKVTSVKYQVPDAEFRIFHPRGFEVSIPAEKGVTLFAFHGKLNERMVGLEAGKWSMDITSTKNGKFIFEDRETSLKLGDIIYYWSFVNHNGLGYRKDNGEYLVTKYSFESSISTTIEANEVYKVPTAQFKIFYQNGFEVSIPADENITLFAFHGKLNEQMEGLEAGRWARDIVTAKYEKFTFRERETSLHIGDIIYYWTYVVYNGLGYREDDGMYAVTHYTPDNENSTSMPTTTTPTTLCNHTLCLGECVPSVTTINNGIPVNCASQLIFEENFYGNSVDPIKWSMERRFPFQPDYEFVIYLLNNEVLRVSDGLAILKPVPLTRTYGPDIFTKELSLGPNCTGILNTDDCIRGANTIDILPPFISSQFSTKARFSFKHGKVEIRAKMPNAPWVYPQLFLEPVESRYGEKNYQSGQIRIAFSRSSGGDFVNELFGGVILNAELPFRNAKMCQKTGPPVDWSADFHVYQMEWLSNRITFSVDNEEYCSVIMDHESFADMQVNGKYLPNRENLKTGSPMAPFDQEFYIRLGYGIGGHNDFPDDPSLWLKEKPWVNFHPNAMRHFWNKRMRNWNHWLNPDAELKLDYIRVFSVA